MYIAAVHEASEDSDIISNWSITPVKNDCEW